MPYFSQKSKDQLATCHHDLQVLFNEVIKHFDCTILEGERGEEAQEEAFNKGYSKAHYGESKHNEEPSMAVDAVPYPINWKDVNRMRYFAGFVIGTSKILKEQGKITHDVISGFDWDSDTELSDTRFQDAPHFELR